MTDRSGFEVTLSSKGLGEAASYDKDRFVFVVGNIEHEVSRFQACFFSGKVRRLVAGDVTAERLVVNVEDDIDLFADIVSLMNGRSVMVNERNSAFLIHICIDLDNPYLFGDIFEKDSDPLSVSEAVSRILIKKEIGRSIFKEVEFLALHFTEAVSVFGFLCDDDIDMILGSDSLKLVNEESLFTFVVSRRDGETGTLRFLRHVRPEFLPEDSLSEYLEYAEESGLWDVWSVIRECVGSFALSCRGKEHEMFVNRYVETESDRLAREKRERDTEDRERQDQATKYKGEPFDGIIGYLRSKCGGNVHLNNIVTVRASSTSQNEPYQVTDRNWDACWGSRGQEDPWIMFDFNNNEICPTHYSLRLKADWHYYPAQWRLDGSNDGSSWKELDNRATFDLSHNDSQGDGQGHSFSCQSGGSAFRYVRLVQTGKSRSKGKACDNRFYLSEVEFFGSVRTRASAP